MYMCERREGGGEREWGRRMYARTDRWGAEIEVCSSAVKENKFWCQIEDPAIRDADEGRGGGRRDGTARSGLLTFT